MNGDVDYTGDPVPFSTLVHEIGQNLGLKYLRSFDVYKPCGGSRH